MILGQRLGKHHVQAGAPDMAAFKGRLQGVEIDQAPACRVDHDRPLGQGRQFGRADDFPRFLDQFRRHGEAIALPEHVL